MGDAAMSDVRDSILIDNYCIIENELGRKKIEGNVFGHCRIPDGEFITSSYIVDFDGVYAKTKTGNVYELGTPSQEYLDFCRSNGYQLPTET